MTIKLVAHRGECEVAPENTIESFALAWARGDRCIEGDFYLSKDGEVVCMHDDNAKHTCGVDRPLAEMTLSEIKQLDAGTYKGDAWKYTKVPTLSEVLATIPEYGEIFIELKSVGLILNKLEAIFATSRCRPKQLSFIASDETTLATLKKMFPDHKVYFLLINWQGGWQGDRSQMLYSPTELANKVKELGLDGVDIHPQNVTEAHVKAIHDIGGEFNVWTIDNVEEAKRLIAMGVDSLTTNRAYALRHELQEN